MPRRKGKPNAKIRRIFLFSKFSARFFIQHPARRRASFPKAGAKVRLFSVHANLSHTFFDVFFEFIFKRIVIQPFTDEWFLMKGLRCTEPYTLLYYIRGKKKTAPDFFHKNQPDIWHKKGSRVKRQSKQDEIGITLGWNWIRRRMSLNMEFYKGHFFTWKYNLKQLH